MTVLGNYELHRMWRRGELLIHPIDERSFQPNSIDVRLGEIIKVAKPDPAVSYYRFDGPIPPYETYCLHCNKSDLFICNHGGFIIYPGQFVLGVTLEKFTVPSTLTCTFENRSSIGRMGLVTVNAGRVDTGWTGRLTLEILNTETYPILLEYGMPIGQLVFTEVIGCNIFYGDKSLGSKYQNDTTAQPRKLGREVD